MWAKRFRRWKEKLSCVPRLASRPRKKQAKTRKAKNEQFDVPFDLVVANGFGGGPGVRAWA